MAWKVTGSNGSSRLIGPGKLSSHRSRPGLFGLKISGIAKENDLAVGIRDLLLVLMFEFSWDNCAALLGPAIAARVDEVVEKVD